MARWTNQTFNHVKALGERLKKNIYRIAEQLADHEDAEYILQRHVNEAFDALSRTGLNRRPWWKRPESFVAAGFAVFGIAAACPDFIGGILPDFDAKATVIRIVMVVLIGVGTALAFFGFLRGAGKV